jgi:hypothetical protein
MRVKAFVNEKGNHCALIEVDEIELTVEAVSDGPGHVRFEGTNTEEWYYLEEHYYEQSDRVIDVLGDRANGRSDRIEWL